MTEFLSIKKFAKLAGLTVRTLQYYDEQGILAPHHKSDAGYRYYSKNEMFIIQKINLLKYMGFNLSQIKIILKDKNFDWLSSLTLQAKLLQDNIKKTQEALVLINHSIDKYTQNNDEPDWNAISKILEILQLEHDNTYKEWINRNFTNTELIFFAEMTSSRNNEKDTELWKNIFAKAKSLMHLSPSEPEVQELAQIVLDNATHQYKGNEGLKTKMWELMKSGDIPSGLIPGYEQEIVIFLSQAIGILFSKN